MLGSYLITYRDGPGRRRIFRAVLEWLAKTPDLEVVVVEQDARPSLAAGDLPPGVRLQFAPNPGPFNKAWGLNIAARIAGSDVVAVGDADVITHPDSLPSCFEACRDRFDAVNPYAHLVDLTETETDAYLHGALPLERVQRDGFTNREGIGEYICFCGGVCVFRRAVYFAVGGMDEHFLGWGAEDDAMSLSLLRYTENLAERRDTTAYHLWHPRDPATRYGHRHYRSNVVRREEYNHWNRADWERHWEQGRRTMGDIGRYADRDGSHAPVPRSGSDASVPPGRTQNAT